MAKKLLLAVIFGTIAGFLLGPRSEVLGEIGLLVIKTLKMLATPLIFFAIADSFHKFNVSGKSGLKLLIISGVNALIAIVIAIGLSMILPISKFVNLDAVKSAMSTKELETSTPVLPHVGFLTFLQGLVPKSLLDPFNSNEVITVALLAVALALALKKLKTKPDKNVDTVIAFLRAGLELTTVLLEWVIRIVPFAVFGVIAKVVGTTGFSAFAALGAFVGIVTLGIFIHIVIYYSLLLILVAKKSPLTFYKEGSEALLTAFTTGSSLATLPVTLKTLDEKMKISTGSSRLAACVGTNLNHDGIILYEAVAALFIAQAHGITLSLGQQINMALSAVLAAIGIAGIPEAGLITLSVVLGAVGLPLSSIPLLLPVDWFIGRLRATANVTSDMIVATILDKTL